MASTTSPAIAVLSVVLAVAKGMPGVDAPLLATLCSRSLGLMGVTWPYATGCAPIYQPAAVSGAHTLIVPRCA